MTRAEFGKLTPEGLIAFLTAEDVALSNKVKGIFQEQEIGGAAGVAQF